MTQVFFGANMAKCLTCRLGLFLFCFSTHINVPLSKNDIALVKFKVNLKVVAGKSKNLSREFAGLRWKIIR